MFHAWISAIRCGRAPPACERRKGTGQAVQGDVLSLDKKLPAKNPSGRPGANVQSKDKDMGDALRAAYQKTVEEEVPDEFLDLLSKLD